MQLIYLMLVAITNMATWETKHVEGGSKGSLCKLYVFFLRLLRVDQKKTEKTKINHSELRWTWTSTGSVLCTKEPFSMDLQLGMLWNGLLDIETSEQNQAWTWKCSQVRKEKKFPTKSVWGCLMCSVWGEKDFTPGTWRLFVISSRFGFETENEIESKRFGTRSAESTSEKTKGNVCGTRSKKPSEIFLSLSAKPHAEPRVRAPQNNTPNSLWAWENVLLFCRRKASPWNAQGAFSSISWYK